MVIDLILDKIIVSTNNIIKATISVKDMKSLTILKPINNKMNMTMGRHLDMYIGMSLLVLLMDMIIEVMTLEDMKIVVHRHQRLDIMRQDHVMIDPDHLIENHPINLVDINLNKIREIIYVILLYVCFLSVPLSKIGGPVAPAIFSPSLCIDFPQSVPPF